MLHVSVILHFNFSLRLGPRSCVIIIELSTAKVTKGDVGEGTSVRSRESAVLVIVRRIGRGSQ
eukprot:4792167-Amphidinium_carterae.1